MNVQQLRRYFSDRRIIGAAIRDIRKQRRMSVVAVARRSGFIRRNVTRLESGGSMPTMETFAAVAWSLNLNPSELMAEIEKTIERRYKEDALLECSSLRSCSVLPDARNADLVGCV